MDKFEIGGADCDFEEVEERKRRLLDLRDLEGEGSETYIKALIEFKEFCSVFSSVKKRDSGGGSDVNSCDVVSDEVSGDVVGVLAHLGEDEEDEEGEIISIPIPKIFYENSCFDFADREVFCDSDLVLGEPLLFVDEGGNRFFSNSVVEEIVSSDDVLNPFYLVKMSGGFEFQLFVDINLGRTAGDF